MGRAFFTLTFLTVTVHGASAHVGHIGELAGHGHWIGLAAGLGATAIAILIAKARKRDEPSLADEPEAESDENAEEAPA